MNINYFIQNKVLKNSIIFSAAVSIVCVLLNQNTLIALPVLLFAYLIMIFGRQFFIFFAIVTLLTIVGEVSTSLRLVVQVISFGGLTILFIKDYGFNKTSYPRIPALFRNFLILFYAVMLLSTLYSDYIMTGLSQVIKISVFFYLMYLFYSALRSDEDIRLYLISLFTAAAIMAFSTFVELLKGGFDLSSLAASVHFRTGGLLGNVNAIGGYYAVCLPVAIILLFHRKISRIYPLTLIMIFVLGMLTVASRSAIVSAAVSILLILFFLNKKLLKIFSGILALLIIMYLVIEPFNEFISFVLRIERGLTRRDYLWQISAEMIKDHFWFGVGPGAWGKEMFNYIPVPLDSYFGRLFIELYEMTGGFNNSHNFYLVYFSDMGIFGLITSLAFPLVFFLTGFRTIRKTRQNNYDHYLLAVGITSAGAGMFIRGFFEGISLITIGRITVDIPFWILIIILVYLYNFHTRFNK